MEKAIQYFVDYLKFEKRYSEHTVTSYQNDLLGLSSYIQQEFGNLYVKEISSSYIRSWLASLKEEKMSSRSIARKISALQSFFKWLVRTKTLEFSPMTNINVPKPAKRLPVFVEEKDMDQLFTQVDFPDSWEGYTDRILLSVFYNTGMRLSELINLREDKIDFGNKALKVLGKGNKERILPISSKMVDSLKDYLQKKRKLLEDPDSKYLLVNAKGKKLYAKYVYRAAKKWLAMITTLDKKSPHVLRHSFATHMANSGADLNAIKELLGHSSLAATQVYTHNTIEKLRDVYKKAHPKA
ncbi:MAG: tyrosine-type recombinase/integrase [Chitinophagales bacterium]